MLLALAEGWSARGCRFAASVSAEPTSTTASSTTVPAVSATATTAKAGHLGKARVNLLLGLLEHIHQITCLLLVWEIVSPCLGESSNGILTVSGEEGNGGTLRASTASTANTVDVILRVVRVVVVQHMSDVANIFNEKKRG